MCDIDDSPDVRRFPKLLDEREQEPGLAGTAWTDNGYDLRSVQRNLKIAADNARRNPGGMEVGNQCLERIEHNFSSQEGRIIHKMV